MKAGSTNYHFRGILRWWQETAAVFVACAVVDWQKGDGGQVAGNWTKKTPIQGMGVSQMAEDWRKRIKWWSGAPGPAPTLMAEPGLQLFSQRLALTGRH